MEILEQQRWLAENGNLSYSESENMPSDERIYWMMKTNEDIERKNKQIEIENKDKEQNFADRAARADSFMTQRDRQQQNAIRGEILSSLSKKG